MDSRTKDSRYKDSRIQDSKIKDFKTNDSRIKISWTKYSRTGSLELRTLRLTDSGTMDFRILGLMTLELHKKLRI